MICYFDGMDENLYVTELGHSKPSKPRTIEPRIREEYLLHIVINGCCKFCEFDVPSESALLISRNVKHSFSADVGFEHYWIGFGGKLASKLLIDHGLSADKHAHLQFSSFPFVHDLLELAHKRCCETANEQIALSTLNACMGLLSDKQMQISKPNDIERAIRFMENNYHRKITMEQISEYVNLSEKHLCRKFTQNMGIPPQKYLLRIRMEAARQFLLNSDLKVKEIAYSVGYDSPLSLSAMYKQFYGISPVEDRLRNQSQSPSEST
jgi:AraC-like DNA-binding protein